jgi:hypothetical protein
MVLRRANPLLGALERVGPENLVKDHARLKTITYRA